MKQKIINTKSLHCATRALLLPNAFFHFFFHFKFFVFHAFRSVVYFDTCFIIVIVFVIAALIIILFVVAFVIVLRRGHRCCIFNTVVLRSQEHLQRHDDQLHGVLPYYS